MRTLTTNLIAILTISALGLAAGNAFACGGGGGGGGFKFGGSYHGGGFGISYGHNNYNHHKVYVRKAYTPVVVYDKCYHPYYSTCFVHPGDTWYTISRRCYGHSHLWKHIAIYNHIGFGSPLVAGMQLRLPVVNGNGTLAVSTAPASAPMAMQGLPAGPQGGSIGPQGMPMGPNSESFAPQGQSFAPQGQPTGPSGQPTGPQGQPTAPQGPTNMPNSAPSDRSVGSPNSDATPAIPAANIRVATEEKEEKTLPTVTIGSTLLLDGQLLGEAKGTVRLRISGMALPVEILEWKISSATIRLPEMDLARAMKAEIEVLRADGSLASKSAVELTPAATRLALGN